MNLDRIEIDPNVMQGKPCVRGLRITVPLVVNLFANGMTEADILHEYPDLEQQDIRQCLRYAAWLAEDRVMGYGESGVAVSG